MAGLSDALQLIHRARRSFRTLDVTLRRWYDAGAAYRAYEHLKARGIACSVMGSADDMPSEVAARLWVELPSRLRQEQAILSRPGTPVSAAEPTVLVVDGERWWRHGPQLGVLADSGLPNGGSYTATGWEPLLDPRWLMAGLALEMVGSAQVAGRRGLHLRGSRPHTEQWFGMFSPPLGEGWDIVIDAERGVVLRLQTNGAGAVFEVQEVTAIGFDEDLPPDTFVFRVPEGETPRVVPELREVTLDEVVNLVPFTVLLPEVVPYGWQRLHVHFWPGWGRPPHRGPEVSIFYASGQFHLRVTQSCDPACAPPQLMWEPVERDGRHLLVCEQGEDWRAVQCQRSGTIVRIEGNADLEILLTVAASLVPLDTASGSPEPPADAGPSPGLG